MDIKAMKATRSKLAATATKLAEKSTITPAEDSHLSTLLDSIENLDGQIRSATDAIKATATERVVGYDAPTFYKQTSRSEIFESDSYDVRTKADMAKRALDVVQTDTGLEVRGEVALHIEQSGEYSDKFRALSQPEYSTGLLKVLAYGPADAHLRMTEAEKVAMARVAHVEARSMSTTDSQGGFALGTAIDPQILVNSTGTANGLRQVARVVTTTADRWRGLYSAGVASAWTPELTEVGDSSPTIGAQEIPLHKAASFIGPVSFELLDGWETMVEQMRSLLAESRTTLENDAFMNGDGVNKPKGLLYMLEQNSAASLSVTTSGQIGAVDVYNLMEALPPRFRRESAFMSSLSVLSSIRAISDDKLGNYVTDLRNGYNFSLLGRPVYESAEMPSMVNGTESSTLAIVGDFSAAYTIVDRLSSSRVSIIPHMFGLTNNRPIGASGIYYSFQSSGSVLTDSTSGECAARILVNPAT